MAARSADLDVRRIRSGGLLARGWVTEVAGVLAVVAIALLLLARLLTSSWNDIFLYNGDSLVLPLIGESIVNNEPFEWVFSSQLFLFPEVPLYAVSALFTTTPQAALMVNACLNLLLLYAVLRVIGALLMPRGTSRLLLVVCSVLSVVLFAAFVVLEPSPSVNGVAVATLYLVTTYYYGAVVAGLTVFVLTLWFIRSRPSDVSHRWLTVTYLASVIVIGTLAATSNPLFLFQFVAPLAATLVVVVFLNRLGWVEFAIIAGAQVVVTVSSMAARVVLAPFLSADVSRYVRPEDLPQSLDVLERVVAELLSSPSGTIKLTLVSAVILVSLALAVRALYAAARPRIADRISSGDVFVHVFVTLSVIILLAGFVATGSTTTRYLLPIFVLPVMGAQVVMLRVAGWLCSRYLTGSARRPRVARTLSVSAIASILTVLTVGALAWGAPRVLLASSGDRYDYPACLDRFLAGTQADGVASFWVGRQLEVYGSHSGDVLQVDSRLGVDSWMINLASYIDQDFSFVVVDGNIITDESVEPLGKPAAVINCPAYEIYDYAGVRGDETLDRMIGKSLETARQGHGFAGE